MPCPPSARLPLDMKDGIDVMVSSSNKCIEGVPGFSYVLVKRDMLVASKGMSHSVVLDLYEQWKGLEANGQFRFTPPTHALVAFHQAMKEHARGGRRRRPRQPLPPATRRSSSRACATWASRRCSPTMRQAPSSRPSSRRAIPISISSSSTRTCACRGFAIYPGKLTKRPSFRIGTIGKVDEKVMKGVLDGHPRRAGRDERHRSCRRCEAWIRNGMTRHDSRHRQRPQLQLALRPARRHLL